MPVITVFGATCCNRRDVIDGIMHKAKFQLVSYEDILKKASSISNIGEKKISDALMAKTSIFNKFTHEKEKAIAYLRLSVAEFLQENNLIMTGMPVTLIPNSINHVLSVCLVGDMDFRMANAINQGISEKQIKETDRNAAFFINKVKRAEDPWAADLYDILLPMHATTVQKSVELILEKAASPALMYTNSSKDSVNDFYLGAMVETRLADKGHEIEVACEQGHITLTIHHNVIMLKKLEDEIREIALSVNGVKKVTTSVGKGFHQSDMYRRYDFTTPSKVLLVDDEREFVQTLSERLILRDMGSVVVFDGESALNIVDEDEPEVMILDLKMPGIDGIEVLRKVKSTKPAIEVIILTGHGSEEDKKICMDLGAFAYLHKPVDIEMLSATLQKANHKIRKKIEDKS